MPVGSFKEWGRREERGRGIGAWERLAGGGGSSCCRRGSMSKEVLWPWITWICRATYSVDGEEYEGTVVNKNVGNKSVTVRFHGYNNEEEVEKKSWSDKIVVLHLLWGELHWIRFIATSSVLGETVWPHGKSWTWGSWWTGFCSTIILKKIELNLKS